MTKKKFLIKYKKTNHYHRFDNHFTTYLGLRPKILYHKYHLVNGLNSN